MIERSKSWEWGQIAAISVILWAIFGSPPPVLGKILGLGGALFLLLYYATGWWEQRREREANQSSSAGNSSSDPF